MNKSLTKNNSNQYSRLNQPSKYSVRNDSLRGFTLIEICIVVAIMGMIIAGGAVFFIKIYDLWLKNSDQIEIQQNARLSMDEMSKYIRQASSPTITLSDMTDSVLISQYSGSETASSLIRFHLIDWTTIQYYQKEGKLFRSRASPGGTSLETEITDNLKELYFIKENPQGTADDYCIHISTLTLEKEDKSVTLRGYIHLKNP